jgi:hypothetical protein
MMISKRGGGGGGGGGDRPLPLSSSLEAYTIRHTLFVVTREETMTVLLNIM